MRHLPTQLPPIFFQTIGLLMLLAILVIYVVTGQVNAGLISAACVLVAAQGMAYGTKAASLRDPKDDPPKPEKPGQE